MQRSVETSELIAYRAEHVVPQRMTHIKEAIAKKDFESFADITMKVGRRTSGMFVVVYQCAGKQVPGAVRLRFRPRTSLPAPTASHSDTAGFWLAQLLPSHFNSEGFFTRFC
jgi:hypothetical protein